MGPEAEEDLFREFFNKSINSINEKYLLILKETLCNIVNVGIWRILQDFDNAI
jgi:hypothetical protein